ncbi:MAG: hypothetical protein M0P69_05445 [Bacteroidales bacterium]|nr:hypothetical protein [Bacteroidales bacterium]
MDNLLLESGSIRQRIHALREHKNRLEVETLSLLDEQTALRKQIELCCTAREMFRTAVDKVYESSRGELERTINLALQYVFYDKDYSIKVEIESKHGKSLSFTVVDGGVEPPLEVDLKEGTGAGLRTVVSFVIHYYYLMQTGVLPYLFVDEGYHNVSVQYRERFFSFIRELTSRKGGGVIIISHDPDILSSADRTYVISDGVVKEKEN